MKKHLSNIFRFLNNSEPTTIWQCFVAGAVNFCKVLAAVYVGFNVANYFSGDVTRQFPWLLMLVLLPVTFLKPFFGWHDKKKLDAFN